MTEHANASFPEPDHHVVSALRQLSHCAIESHPSCVPETLDRMAAAATRDRPDIYGPPPSTVELDAGLTLIAVEQSKLKFVERDLIAARMDAGGTWAEVATARELPSADAARQHYRRIGGQRTWPAGRPGHRDRGGHR